MSVPSVYVTNVLRVPDNSCGPWAECASRYQDGSELSPEGIIQLQQRHCGTPLCSQWHNGAICKELKMVLPLVPTGIEEVSKRAHVGIK